MPGPGLYLSDVNIPQNVFPGFAFLRNTDPATTWASFVQPGMHWFVTDDDTTPTTITGHKVRNPANDGWLDGAAVGSFATEAYVDGKVAGLSWKQAVRAATTGAGTLATDFENGDTIDGVVLATGDRILIKNQAAPAENGIYVVAASGAPARATDADAGAELVNATVYVSEGTTNGDTQWTCSTDAPITVDTTSLIFAQLTAGGGGIPQTLIDAKGDLVAGSAADTPARLAVGADGLALLAASGETTGLKWGTPVAPVESESGATYTLVLADAQKYKRFTNAAGCQVTVPANASVAFPVGTEFHGLGTQGQIEIVEDSGVTVNTPETLFTTKAFSVFGLKKVGTNEWDLFGDLELV